VIKEFIYKKKPPFLIYNSEDKLNTQTKLLSLLPDKVLNNIKWLDEKYLSQKYKNNLEKTDFKVFSSAYGSGTIKKFMFFNKKNFFSKNLKQASVIWPLIKKEDVSKILSLESIYDSIFNDEKNT
jgi:hypothetical protein